MEFANSINFGFDRKSDSAVIVGVAGRCVGGDGAAAAAEGSPDYDNSPVPGVVDEDRYCADVLTQINAVGSALHEVGRPILEDPYLPLSRRCPCQRRCDRAEAQGGRTGRNN